MLKTDYSSTDGEIPVVRWSNRRRLAWYAFIILVVGTAIYWFGLPLWFQFWDLPTTWLETIGDSYSWFASAMTMIIAAYLGFNSLSEIKDIRSGRWGSGSRTYRESTRYDNDDVGHDDEEIYDPNKVK